MFDFRAFKIIDLADCEILKEESTAYLYYDDNLHKKYVLKTFEGNLDDPYFLTEFRKMMLLSAEPEIGTSYGLVTVRNGSDQQAGYLMEFIQGKSLEELIQEDRFIEFDQYIEVISQIAAGMEKAHHYRVFHNDLHAKNVMIDDLKDVKIIDFLWNDYLAKGHTEISYDVECFIKIENALFSKLSSVGQKKAEVICKYCKQIKSFKGVGKYISSLGEVSDEMLLLSLNGHKVLGYLVNFLPNDYKLSDVIEFGYKDNDICGNLLPIMTAEDIKLAELHAVGPFKHPDSRMARLEDRVSRHLRQIFHQLHQAGFCNYRISITGERRFYGPYTIVVQIDIAIKTVKWQKLNKQFPFLPQIDPVKFDSWLFSCEWVKNPLG